MQGARTIKYLPLISILLISVLLSACSPRSSYMVLSFFFDGVPDHNRKSTAMPVDSVRNGHRLPVDGTLAGKLPTDMIFHQPYQQRNCLSCHDKGINNTSLKEQPKMCYACHQDYALKYKYVHGPVSGGYCSTCHNSHKGKLANLLKQPGQQLCQYCHLTSDIMKNPAHNSQVSDNCLTCHDPHGGSNRYVLK